MPERHGSERINKRIPREKETNQQSFCSLDGIGLSISMQLSAASSLKRNALPNSTLMKYFIATFALFALAMPMVAQEKSFPLKDLKDKASYSIGVDIALNFKKQNMDLNPDALAAGAKDGLNGKPQISPNEVRR